MTLDEPSPRDIVLGRHASETPPDLIVCVVDATNLRLNLRLVLELKRLGMPMVVALNMTRHGPRRGFPARPRGSGARASGCRWSRQSPSGRAAKPTWWRCWTDPTARGGARAHRLRGRATRPRSTPRQAEVRRILGRSATGCRCGCGSLSALDAVVLHPVSGPVMLAVILFLIFQAVFAWAQVPMDAIKPGVDALGDWAGARAARQPAEGPAHQRRARRASAACWCSCRRSSSCSSSS